MTINSQTTPKINLSLLNFVRPSPHSTFSPSSADRWIACPFSVEFTKNIPEQTSKYSEEGTIAHSVCEAVFRQEFYGLPFPLELQMDMMKWDHQEMMTCAFGYVEVIQFWLNNKSVIGDIIWYGLERGVPIFPEEGCFGTADCLIVGTKGAAVIDYKHGKGKNVKADSLQLRVYAAGVYRHMTAIPLDYKFISVVYQPRTDQHPKEHTFTVEETFETVTLVRDAIEATKQPNLQPISGNHCFWCPASRTKDPNLLCPTIKAKQIGLAQENFAGFLNDMNSSVDNLVDVNTKRDAAIVKLMALYPLIKKTVEDGAEEFKLRTEKGEVVPGVRLIEVLGNREIAGDDEKYKIAAVEAFVDEINPLFTVMKEVPATKKLKTITELEKELGKGALDPICTRKITKKVEVIDEKINVILGEMAAYAEMINNAEGQEDS